MTFRVGQKVVAVNNAPSAPGLRWDDDERLTAGETYTVTSVHVHMGNLVLWLAEIQRNECAVRVHGPLVGYGAWRFRPLIDTTKQVEAIKSLIKPIFEGKTVEMVQ